MYLAGVKVRFHHPPPWQQYNTFFGLDHGVGHSLLLLDDAKAPRSKNSNYFNGLGYSYPSISVSLLKIITKHPLFITI